ncbi:hypothetical protein [Kordiimonas sp.]|uniref:hypothetical protein n=1 Tax=Kordiimonas sp. TaxID=1970157 RepID=UPI003A91D56E
MKTITPILKSTALLLTGISMTAAVHAAPIDMNPSIWEFSEDGASFEKYLGRDAIKLSGGVATIKGETFKNGVIEFDMAMPDARGFAGIYFRGREGNNSEEFYLRSHLSGMPDANQYTPVFNGTNAWQLLHGPRYSAQVTYNFDTWTHVKLVVKDAKMDVYIDSEDPVLHVDNLFHGVSEGSITLSGFMNDYYYSNVDITNTDDVTLRGEASPLPELPENLIKGFSVGSRVVAASAVEGKTMLDPALLEGQTWQWLDIDEAGSANLARLAPRTREANTQLVRVEITADKAQLLPFKYGYSDRVSLFVNDTALAHGNNTYANRDYRYLGTIGLFETAFLPLKPGKNEVVFAVSEAFGGWGFMAAVDVPKGVSVH